MSSGPIGPLSHGLYRLTARLGMQGLPRSLGTGIALAVQGVTADGKPVGKSIASRTIYLADFDGEDVWQQFAVDFDHHPPLVPPRLLVLADGSVSPTQVVLAISIVDDSRIGGGGAGGRRGNSTPFASLRRLAIESLGIARLPEPIVVIRDLRARKAWLRAGERQDFEIDLHNRSSASRSGELRLAIE